MASPNVDKLTSDLEQLDVEKDELRRRWEDLPAVGGGLSFILKLWRDTMLCWLEDNQNEVYLATPFLDPEYLKEILELVLRKKTTANIKHFFVRQNCYNDRSLQESLPSSIETINGHDTSEKYKWKFQDIWEYVMRSSFSPEERQFLESRVHGKVAFRSFHAKFIGRCNTKDHQAAVLLTSANFTSQHFGWENLDFIAYNEMKEDAFERKIIKPLR